MVGRTHLDVKIAFGQYLVFATFLELALQHDLAHFEIRIGHVLSLGQQRLVRHFQLDLGLFLFGKLPVTRLHHGELVKFSCRRTKRMENVKNGRQQ